MRTPESIAEIGAGAEEWASGSQAWKGTSAAFSPNPTRKKAEVIPMRAPPPPPRSARTSEIRAMLRFPVAA
jgi:hypothetical protein